MTKVRVLAYRSKTMANKRQFQIYTPEMAVHLRNNKIYYYIFTRLENKEDAKKYIYPAIRCFKTLFPKTYDRQNIRIVTLDLYLLDMPLLAPPVEFDPDHEKPQSEDTIYEDMPPLEPASPVLHSSSISFNIDQNIVPLDKAPSSGETTPRPPSTDVANDPPAVPSDEESSELQEIQEAFSGLVVKATEIWNSWGSWNSWQPDLSGLMCFTPQNVKK